jgi:hypothetical protein
MRGVGATKEIINSCNQSSTQFAIRFQQHCQIDPTISSKRCQRSNAS